LSELELKAWLSQGFMFLGDENELWLGFGDEQVFSKPMEDQISVFAPDYFLEWQKPWHVFQNHRRIQIDPLIEVLKNVVQPPGVWRWLDPEVSSYRDQFECAKKNILENKMSKAVPVMFAHGSHTNVEFERPRLILNLLENSKGRNPYGIWNRNSGVLGLSPEILFHIKANVLKTMALAGTRSPELEKQNSLLKDIKEMKEHQLVVEGLQLKLSEWGRLEKGETYVWQIGDLCHLRTDFNVCLKQNYDFEFLAKSLHPTAALGFSPVTIPIERMREFEPAESRGRFGAPFGLRHSSEDACAIVGIRNIEWESEKIRIGTGSGIVRESTFENEWVEHSLKRDSVRKIFGLDL
jgi:menaquinone-specific isochorismate synthase